MTHLEWAEELGMRQSGGQSASHASALACQQLPTVSACGATMFQVQSSKPGLGPCNSAHASDKQLRREKTNNRQHSQPRCQSGCCSLRRADIYPRACLHNLGKPPNPGSETKGGVVDRPKLRKNTSPTKELSAQQGLWAQVHLGCTLQ